jgi:hypothetical protein
MNAHQKLLAAPDHDVMQIYVDAGYALVPLHRPGEMRLDKKTGEMRDATKSPVHRNWQKRHYDSATVLADCRAEGRNVGVRPTADDLIIDVDPKNGGEESFKKLCADSGLDPRTCPRVITGSVPEGSNGGHYYLRRDPALKIGKAHKAYPGIDFLSCDSYQAVAAGSVHPNGRLYRWDPELPLLADAPMMPDGLVVALARKPKDSTSTPADVEVAPEQLAAMLVKLDATQYRDGSSWREMLFACHHATKGAGRDAFVDWSASDPEFAAERDKTTAAWARAEAERAGGVTAATLFKALKDAGHGDLIPGSAPCDPDIEAMNAEHAVVHIGGKTRILTWHPSLLYPGQREPVLSTYDDFKFLHRRRKTVIMVKKRDKDGHETGLIVPKRVSLVSAWLNHPKCRQYNAGWKFLPGLDAPEVGDPLHRTLNLWQGFAFTAKQGDWSLFKRHLLDNICGGNTAYYAYLLKWMAFVVQRRRPTNVVILLRSPEEGTGKSFVAEHFCKLFGPAGWSVTNPEHVVGKFNPHLESILVLNADEALFAGDPRHRNSLWGLTTDPTITVEPKGIGVYKAVNHLNFIITTNADEAVRVTRTARRIFALDVAPNQVGNPEYFDAIKDQLNAGGYEAMLHELQTMDLTGFDVRQCPKTEALARQMAHGRRGIDRLVEEACSTGIVPGASHTNPGFSLNGSVAERTGFEGHVDRDPDLKRLGTLAIKYRLRDDWGCEIGEKARKREHAKGLPLRGILWPTLSELRAKFVALHGQQQWANPDAIEWLRPEVSADATMTKKENAVDQHDFDDEIPF